MLDRAGDCAMAADGKSWSVSLIPASVKHFLRTKVS